MGKLASGSSGGEKMDISVIVVDDDLDCLETLVEYLELKDIQVVAKAKNGKEAVEFYERYKPEVVLLDIVMPHYDGFYTLEQIKSKNPNAKVIFVTGATSETTQKRLFESNVDGLLFKPFDMDKLVEALSTVKSGGKFIPTTVRSRTIGS